MFKINLKRWVALVGLVALTGVLLGSLFTGTALAQGPAPQTPGPGWGPGYMNGGWGYHGGQSGMMGGWGYGPNAAPGGNNPLPYGYGYGNWQPGMIGGWGHHNWGNGSAWGPGSNHTPHYGYGYGWDD